MATTKHSLLSVTVIGLLISTPACSQKRPVGLSVPEQFVRDVTRICALPPGPEREAFITWLIRENPGTGLEIDCADPLPDSTIKL